MKPAVEKAIEKYLNSPDGDIKKIYPIIDKVDFNYRLAPPNTHPRLYVTVDLYLDTPPTEKHPYPVDLWSYYNLDEIYLMDYHMPNIYRLFGLKSYPYIINVHTPDTEGGYYKVKDFTSWS